MDQVAQDVAEHLRAAGASGEIVEFEDTVPTAAVAAARLGCDPEFVLASTGQPVGGVAPVGHPTPIRTVVDSALTAYPTVWAGGGTKHTMFPTSHDELVRLTDGHSTEARQDRPNDGEPG